MDDTVVRYYEVELTFTSEQGVMVPVTASSPEEAKAHAEAIFRDAPNLNIISVRDISDQTAQLTTPAHLKTLN